MHGVSFKKRAPRAIKEIREFAVKAMVSFFTLFSLLRPLYVGEGKVLFFANEMMGVGYERRPTRSPTQQEGVGGWD